MNVVNFFLMLQIVLESFPVSSSGNIAFFTHLFESCVLHSKIEIMHEGLYFLLHGPTVLVLGLYFLKPWWNYLVGFVQLKQSAVQMIVCVIVADLVTVGFYCGLKLMGNPDVPLTIGFLITTSALVSLRFMPNEPGLPRFARNDAREKQ
jgi:undecaprenyl pyrophosphate phosphatase UppP